LNRKHVAAVGLLLVVAALHWGGVPRSIWEFDESFFAMGVEQYQPLLHHPPPPGYPVYMAFAKAVALFTRDAFQALVVTSILGLIAGLVTWFLALRELTEDWMAASLGTALLYLSPALLVSGTLPQSDSGALALLGLAVWACARREPQFAAIACAACIGWRVQFVVAVIPLFLASLIFLKSWRDRVIAIGTFGAACLLWFVPLLIATEGPEGFWKWLSGQAAYYAQHDSNLSRTGYDASLIALRFLAHPWGPKWLALPLLALAAVGLGMLVMRKEWRMVPLLLSSAVYFAFALATMDPADAVRYAIPALPAVAALAGLVFARISSIGVMVAACYAFGAVSYAMPVTKTRADLVSPPAAAAEWIRTNVPRNTIVLYDLPLRPHADYLLRGYRVMHIDAGLSKFGGDPSVPMMLLTDGERAGGPGMTFRWPDTDAYRKLTRQHYGAVSVVPLAPFQRYRVREGVFAQERTRAGESWRWIGARGVLELPDVDATSARLVFRATQDYPLPENRVRLLNAGREYSAILRKNAQVSIDVPLQDGVNTITIQPERNFVPAQLPATTSRDTRTLSVMLTTVEQRTSAGPATGRPPT
jgi:hypothetical protein